MSEVLSSPSMQLHDGTDVPLTECFPIADSPARSADCVSWGPHNVLQVCTHWSISFYLSSLHTPAQRRQIRHHPLCHRTDVETMEVVEGARWSVSLLPEVYYPATARLCVRTTSNLVVYRVARRGTTRVEVSCGIGIICCNAYIAAADKPMEAVKVRVDSPAAVSVDSPTIATAADTAVSPAPPEGASRKRKPGPKAAPQPAKKKAATQRGPGRRKRTSNSSSSSSDTDDDDSSSSSSSPSSSSSSSSKDDSSDDGTAKRGRGRPPKSSGASGRGGRGRGRGASAAGRGPGQRVDTDNETAPERRGAAKGHPDHHHHSDTDGGASQDSRSWGAATLLDYMWLPQDELLVMTTRGLHVVSFYGNLSDDESPQTVALPPPVYTWGGAADAAALRCCGPIPVCFCPVATTGLSSQTSGALMQALQRTVVVASPYVLRVLRIHADPCAPTAPATAELVQYVDLPSLTAVPSCVCAIATAPAAPASGTTVNVVSFVAAPCRVLRGSFRLSVGGAAASPKAAKGQRPSSSPLRPTAWTADAEFGPDVLAGEVALRQLLVVPCSAEMEGQSGHSVGSSVAIAGAAAVAVVGVGDRSLVQFFLSGPSCVRLFQCPLLAGRSAMPARRCAGVCGVALHSSGTVAVMAVRSGLAADEPVHLWPVTVDGPSSWLRRLVEVAGLLRHLSEDEVAGDATDRSPAGGGGKESSVTAGTALRNTRYLVQSQLSDCYFLREQLLGESVKQSSDLHRYAQVLQEARQFPSVDVRQQGRAASVAPALTPSCSRRVPDLRLRHAYLQLRQQHGVSLFLRWPAPLSDSASGEPCASLVAADAVLASHAASWPWWRILRHVWATCPWEIPVLSELVLARAIRILAQRFGVANLAFTPSERFREREGAAESGADSARRCATDPDTVDVDGARCFVEAYVRNQEGLLQRAATAAAAEQQGDTLTTNQVEGELLLTAADCEPVPLTPQDRDHRGAEAVHWCVSPLWVDALRAFLRTLSASKAASAATVSSESSATLFPCSLCDRENAVAFPFTLSTVSTHVPRAEDSSPTAGTSAQPLQAATHTTLFSGTTLSPLSFFSADYVMTRCLSCGMCDYATGPLCRVCGGLLE